MQRRQKKEPSLIQTSSGVWYARYRDLNKDVPIGMRTLRRRSTDVPDVSDQSDMIQVNGKWYPRNVYDRFVTEFSSPYMQGTLDPVYEEMRATVSEAAEKFLSQGDRREKTIEGYRSILSLFDRSLLSPHIYLDEITKEDVYAFLHRPAIRSDASRRSYFAHLKSFFRWAEEKGYVDSAADHLPTLRRGRSQREQQFFLHPDHLQEVFALIERNAARLSSRQKEQKALEWVIPVIKLAVGTGMRLGELAHLRWRNVHESRGLIEVRDSTGRGQAEFKTKTGAHRHVPIHPIVQNALAQSEALAGTAQPEDFVLVSPSRLLGLRTGQIDGTRASRIWKKYISEVLPDQPFKFHGLRHIHITWMLALGYSETQVMNATGHTVHKTMQGYVRWADTLTSQKERASFLLSLEEFGFERPLF
jgi:integrase